MYTVYMHTCNIESPKRSAKGSNFKEDDNALLVYGLKCHTYSWAWVLQSQWGY